MQDVLNVPNVGFACCCLPGSLVAPTSNLSDSVSTCVPLVWPSAILDASQLHCAPSDTFVFLRVILDSGDDDGNGHTDLTDAYDTAHGDITCLHTVTPVSRQTKKLVQVTGQNMCTTSNRALKSTSILDEDVSDCVPNDDETAGYMPKPADMHDTPRSATSRNPRVSFDRIFDEVETTCMSKPLDLDMRDTPRFDTCRKRRINSSDRIFDEDITGYMSKSLDMHDTPRSASSRNRHVSSDRIFDEDETAYMTKPSDMHVTPRSASSRTHRVSSDRIFDEDVTAYIPKPSEMHNTPLSATSRNLRVSSDRILDEDETADMPKPADLHYTPRSATSNIPNRGVYSDYILDDDETSYISTPACMHEIPQSATSMHRRVSSKRSPSIAVVSKETTLADFDIFQYDYI